VYECSYLKKKLSSYTSDEAYSLSFLCLYTLWLSTFAIIGFSFEFAYTNFNSYGTNVTTYANLVFAVCIYCIPSRIAKMRHLESVEELENERKKSLDEKILSKQRYIRYISHEMRTPIGICNSSISFVLEELKKRKDAHEVELIQLLEDGLHACDSAVSILNDMSTHEAIDVGKFSIFPETLPAVLAIESVLHNIEPIGRNKNISFVLENRLSSDDCDKLLIQVDSPKIEQVFLNIAANNVKQQASESDYIQKRNARTFWHHSLRMQPAH